MPKAPSTNSTAPPPAAPAPAHSVPLSDTERLTLDNALLRAQLAELHATQARHAAIDVVRALLTAHGEDPGTVPQWQVDVPGGRLVRAGGGRPGDTGG